MEIKIDDLFFVVGQLQKILKKIAGKLSLKTETLKIFDSISYKTGNNSTPGWNFLIFSTVLKRSWLGAKTRLWRRWWTVTGKGRKLRLKTKIRINFE